MSKIVYALFYLLSLLPFWALYRMADLGYLLLYRVVGYRKKVVRKNLSEAFPEKSEQELVDIERQFYHWFCDYFLEAVKLLSISDKELDKRFHTFNTELVESYMAQGRQCAVMLGHHCNWEWLSCVGKDLPSNRIMGLIYHPLYNKAFDNLFIRIRSRIENGVTIPKKDILRRLVEYRRDGIMTLFGYIADQGPKWENIHLWLPFLNHDTPVFTGAERIIRKVNNVVFYIEMDRPRRGYYTATFHLISDDPNALPENEVTRLYFQKLEETIRKKPQYYLWTHNRWKRSHEEFDRRFVIKHGKVVPREDNNG